ncbi:MAG: diguanylate cyclase [Nitrosomonadales bacterium]|nr:diguanylate cyclase [Nitrosomonadales bacterium]
MDRTELTIERNALASLLLALAVTGIIVWMNAMGVVRIANNTDQMVRYNTVVEKIMALKELLLLVESSERGYIITGDDTYLESHERSMATVFAVRDDLVLLLADAPSDQAGLSELGQHLEAKFAVSRANVRVRKQGFERARGRVLEGAGKREMDALQAILERMSGMQTEHRDGLRSQRKMIMEELGRNITIAAVVAVSVLLYLHFRLLRAMKLRHEAEQHMHYIATHDMLTGLPNRRLVLEHIAQALHRCMRHKKSMALLFLDLNGFKPVNDRYGHKAGDEVLKQIAQRLSAVMRASDRVARLGGDEFVVLAEDVTDKEDVCGIVGKIDAEIERPFRLHDGNEVSISTSIGVAVYPRDGEDMETLLRNADTAMYEAKQSLSNCFCKEQTHLRRCVLRKEGAA